MEIRNRPRSARHRLGFFLRGQRIARRRMESRGGIEKSGNQPTGFTRALAKLIIQGTHLSFGKTGDRKLNAADKQLSRVARRALVRIGVKPGSRILDFGARVGNYSLPAADLVTRTGKVYALDKDRESLDELMTNGSHLPQLVRIDTDGGPNIPLSENSMDMILLFDVDLNKPTPYLKEFHRVLTSKGILALYLPIEDNRDTAGCEEFVTKVKNADFKLLRKVEQEMVHWDWVEEATVYLFQPCIHA